MWSGIGCPTAAVVYVNALLRTRCEFTGPGVAGMMDFGKQPHPVNLTSPVRLRGQGFTTCHAVGP